MDIISYSGVSCGETTVIKPHITYDLNNIVLKYDMPRYCNIYKIMRNGVSHTYYEKNSQLSHWCGCNPFCKMDLYYCLSVLIGVKLKTPAPTMINVTRAGMIVQLRIGYYAENLLQLDKQGHHILYTFGKVELKSNFIDVYKITNNDVEHDQFSDYCRCRFDGFCDHRYRTYIKA